jgi:hypothetical protein
MAAHVAASSILNGLPVGDAALSKERHPRVDEKGFTYCGIKYCEPSS